MQSKEVKVNLKGGLNARPLAMLVQVASRYDSEIHIGCDGRKVNAKSIMGMMSLGLPEGQVLEVNADGQDESDAITAIEEYLLTGSA
ncbi:MAG: HPr family phosphocarrier protein [Lachnospiraceae bacterium]|nr:HPr family phosphocarrier protein [Lachnospiraceae bacterium]